MEDFEFIKRVSNEEIRELLSSEDVNSTNELLKPYDYIKIFEPKNVEALRKIVGLAEPVGSGDRPGMGGDEAPSKPSHGKASSIKDLL